ncbi:MAG: extracellular solute-binding protein [Ruminococcus sp.]|nr:extracellular solute-binding protein [Ruminococcus sp.]
MRIKRLAAGLLAAIMIAGLMPVSVNADQTLDDAMIALADESEVNGFVKQITYSDYYDINVDAPRPNAEAYLTYKGSSDGAEVTADANFEGKSGVTVWENQSGTLEYTVEVPEDGNYNFEMSYFPITGGNTVSEISLLIDGVSPYDTATRISVPRRWGLSYPIMTDENDNEILSPQIEKPTWLTTLFQDNDGLFNEPLLFNLTKGTHTITFKSEKSHFAIEYVKIFNEAPLAAYVKPSPAELSANANADIIHIEGEKYAYASEQALVPSYERNMYSISPSNPVKQRYNTVGGGVWDTALQELTWEFKVYTPGYYKVAVKARQNEIRGLSSNRRFKVDGAVPNEHFDQVQFKFSNDFVNVTATDENGDPAYVYLDEGDHSITLEVVPGEIGEAMRALDAIVYEVNAYYMDILMITGPSPDRYTDYNIHMEIPGITDAFTRLSGELVAQMDYIEDLAGTRGTTAGALERLADVLDYCVKYPRRIPDSIRNAALKNNVSAVSAWMRENRQQPLEVDYIEIVPADQNFTKIGNNFFKSAGFDIEAFVGSFFEDYTVLSKTTINSINVWVNVGRDQTNIVKQMTDSQFIDETGIPVSINLVQGAIMEAVLAGKGPDVAMFLGGEFPVNLAMRDLVIPMDDFDGFDEVTTRFQEYALTHYQFDGKTYGIPITQSFPMMFYRIDVLSELGIDAPPETWEDLIDMLPAIQRKYLQPGLALPMAAAAGVSISPSIEIGHTFAMLMLQADSNYYNEDQTRTLFDTQTAYDAFAQWTDYYNIYKFDQTYDGFTRFRTGETPIIIQNYNTFYNQLNVAAPEIKGLWDFTLVPGTVLEDGTVSHAANSNGSGAIILKDCKNPAGAWEYIKWFTDTPQMVQYAQNVEGILGAMGRVDVANQAAMDELNWSTSDLAKIKAQWAQLREIPISPSAYVVTREVMNAFREVVNNKWNPREILNEYNVRINAEITRKRENLGIQ